jgi:hypothetical protein
MRLCCGRRSYSSRSYSRSYSRSRSPYSRSYSRSRSPLPRRGRSPAPQGPPRGARSANGPFPVNLLERMTDTSNIVPTFELVTLSDHGQKVATL